MIINEFEKVGYYIHYKGLNAFDFGVPQKRERVFIVGFKNFEDYFNFKFPQSNTLNNFKIFLKQVIDKKADEDQKWFFSPKAVEGMLRVREKMNKGRVQNLDQPCNTISSNLAKVNLNGTDPILQIGERYRLLLLKKHLKYNLFSILFSLTAFRKIDNTKLLVTPYRQF